MSLLDVVEVLTGGVVGAGLYALVAKKKATEKKSEKPLLPHLRLQVDKKEE